MPVRLLYNLMICLPHVANLFQDQAVVQATKLSGGASTWGEATRSQKEKACWVGDWFKVCTWAQ